MQYVPALVSYLWYVSLSHLPSVCSLDSQILKAAERVSASYDALIDLFEHLEHFLKRLKVLTEIPSALGGIVVKIMVVLLEVLALATQKIKQGRFSEFVLANTSHFA